MAISQYGTYAPQEDQPSSMENTLAHLAYSGYSDSPAEAQTALDQYWLERQLNKQDYKNQLQDQHQYAYDQLAQQLTEARWKAMGEAKDPTVLQLMSHDPSSPLSGIGAPVLNDLIARARQGQDMTNLEHGGAGVNSLSQAGFDPTGVAASVGMNLGPYLGPASVQAARIKAAAQMAAARLQGQQANLISANIGLPESGYGTNASLGVKLDPTKPIEPQLAPYAQVVANLNGQPVAAPSGQPTQPAPVSKKVGMPATGTNLQPAARDTGTATTTPSGHAYLPTQTKEGQQAQVLAMQKVREWQKTNPQLYAKTRPPANGVFKIVPQNGRLYVEGNDGNGYAIN